MTTSSPRGLRAYANGLEHSVLEWLPSTVAPARTLMLVHGYMDAAGTWDLVAPALADAGFRVLAPDMRGFGEGARAVTGGYYHFVDYVFDLADLIETFSPSEPIGLVGHSMGGAIATLFSGAFPERIWRFANIEGVGPSNAPWEMGPVRMRSWIEEVRASRARDDARSTFTPEEALRRLSLTHPSVSAAVLATRVPHLATEVGGGRLSWRFDPLHRTTSPMPFFSKLFVEFAKKVTCPVLFVSGGPTGFHPADEDERVGAFAHCSRAEVAGAGHMMHWTAPDRLADLLLLHFGADAPSS